MIFQVFLAMPRPDVDHFTANELVAVLKASYMNYLVMTVGMILILLYWGQTLVLRLESISLAIAGGIGVWALHYANRQDLISEAVTGLEKDKTYLKLMPGPITSVLTFPFAVFGPNIRTISWLLMVPVSFILKRIFKRMNPKD